MQNINIVSEVELRYNNKIKNSERQQIKSSEDSIKVFRSIDRYNNNVDLFECFYAMYLNKAMKILSVMLISEGGSSSTIVDIKKIIAPAILQNTSAIIVSHNHPSGNAKPSNDDERLTLKITTACKILDILLADHIIITSESYFSFADECML
jgi:DNA repair protein RadC